MNKYPGTPRFLMWSLALILTGAMAGCGSGGNSRSAATPAGNGGGVPFATSNNSTAPGAVNLGTAASFAILAKSAVSTTGTTTVVGHVGVSPAAESFLTGFSQARDATNEFSTSSLVTGHLYAADMAPPTPTKMTTAISDMELAYTDAAGRPGGGDPSNAGDLGGLTIAPGTHTIAVPAMINSDVTLSGTANDVWIFQLAQGLTQANGTRVILAGGALAKNIFWQTFGVAAIGTTSHFEGVILSSTSISMNTGATANGRLLAQTAVTLNANAVTQPAN